MEGSGWEGQNSALRVVELYQEKEDVTLCYRVKSLLTFQGLRSWIART